VFDAKLVQDKIMDHFERVFSVLSNTVIESYQAKSISADSVKNYKRKLLAANGFSDFKSDLKGFLDSHYLSEKKSGVFCKTLLRVAGIESIPTAWQIDSYDAEKMFFRIQGINEQEAESFFNFLKNNSKDESSSYSYVKKNNVLDINNSDSRLEESYQFLVDKKLVHTIVLPWFKEQFSAITKELMRDYSAQSSSDPEVMQLIKSEVNSQERRFEPLEEFLIPHLISTELCTIFEETLLQMAQINSLPLAGKCHPLNKKVMQFSYQNMQSADTEKLECFFNSTLLSNCEVIKDPDSTYFIVDIDKVVEIIIPMFINEFIKIAPHEIRAYQKLSETHSFITLLRLQNIVEDIIKLAADIETHCENGFLQGGMHVINIMLKSLTQLNNEANNPEAALQLLEKTSFTAKIYSDFSSESSFKSNKEVQELAVKFNQFNETLDAVIGHLPQLGFFSAPIVRQSEGALSHFDGLDYTPRN